MHEEEEEEATLMPDAEGREGEREREKRESQTCNGNTCI